MKKRLEWFIVPCVATMFAGNPVSLHAQETPKAKRNLNVVIHHSQDDDEAKNVRDKVAKELEKSGISEEIKARILKDVHEALSKAQKKLTLKSKKSLEEAESEVVAAKEQAIKLKEQAKRSKDQAMKQAEDAVAAKEMAVQMLERVERLNPGKGFTTHLFVDPKNDSYRIGVQCIQAEVEEGDDEPEVKEGLEVQAVFDDSPAKKAGLEEGDVLLTIDSTKINKISDLTNALQEAGKKEKEVTIEAKRDEKVISVTVKPTKMKSSDIGLENIRLSLPTEGFVVSEEALKNVQERLNNLGTAEKVGSTQVWNFKSDSDALKKDLEELKSDMAELKKMIKELAGKKSE
jgi:C-terminal processing protease CtpA/Prc